MFTDEHLSFFYAMLKDTTYPLTQIKSHEVALSAFRILEDYFKNKAETQNGKLKKEKEPVK